MGYVLIFILVIHSLKKPEQIFPLNANNKIFSSK